MVTFAAVTIGAGFVIRMICEAIGSAWAPVEMPLREIERGM